jgi:hypothetical protein
MNWITVPAATVLLEGRKMVDSASFQISSRPITAAEFALFSKRENYVTEAEKLSSEYSVYNNPTLDQVPTEEWSNISAVCLSHSDASAFCQAFRGSLPSSVQWLAFVDYVTSNRLFAFPRRPDMPAVDFAGPEWLRLGDNGVQYGWPPIKRFRGVPLQKVPRGKVIGSDARKLLLGGSFRLVKDRSVVQRKPSK